MFNKILIVAFSMLLTVSAAHAGVTVSSQSHQSTQLNDLSQEAQNLLSSHAAFLSDHGVNVASQPLTIHLLSSRDEYESFKAQSGARSESPRGYYEHNKHEIVTWEPMSSGVSSDLQRILTHETFHHQLHSALGDRIPLWLDEGMAVLFENAASAGGGRMDTASIHRGAVAKLKEVVVSHSGLPLDQLLTLDRQAFYNSDATMNYALAWSLVHFLTNDASQKQRHTLDAVLQAVQNGGDVREALLKTNGNNPAGFQAEWARYISRL